MMTAPADESSRHSGAIRSGRELAQPCTGRFDALDAMRGVAAISIALYHLTGIAGIVSFAAAPNGYLAVDFFFCLSGFVIAGIYDQRLADGLSERTFITRRLIRFYPFYFLSLWVGVAAWSAEVHFKLTSGASVSSFATALLLGICFLPTLSPLGTIFYPFNTPAWSLLVELLVNGVYARYFKHINRRAIFRIAGACGLLMFILICKIGTDNWGFSGFMIPGVLRAGYSFFAGVAVRRFWKPETPPQASFWLLVAVLLAAAVAPLSHGPVVALNCIFIFILSPLIVYAGATLPRDGGHGGAPMQVLGSASYGFYTLHEPVLLLIFAFIHPAIHSWAMDGLLLIAGVCGIALLLAVTGVYAEFVEGRFQRSLSKHVTAAGRTTA